MADEAKDEGNGSPIEGLGCNEVVDGGAVCFDADTIGFMEPHASAKLTAGRNFGFRSVCGGCASTVEGFADELCTCFVTFRTLCDGEEGDDVHTNDSVYSRVRFCPKWGLSADDEVEDRDAVEVFSEELRESVERRVAAENDLLSVPFTETKCQTLFQQCFQEEQGHTAVHYKVVSSCHQFAGVNAPSRTSKSLPKAVAYPSLS